MQWPTRTREMKQATGDPIPVSVCVCVGWGGGGIVKNNIQWWFMKKEMQWEFQLRNYIYFFVGPIQRVITHPAFQNIAFEATEKFLATMDQGEAVFRPSKKVCTSWCDVYVLLLPYVFFFFISLLMFFNCIIEYGEFDSDMESWRRHLSTCGYQGVGQAKQVQLGKITCDRQRGEKEEKMM